MNKEVKNAQEALIGVHDGMTFMLGGFGLCGIPEKRNFRISSTWS